MGRFNSYQQPGKVERLIVAAPKLNVNSISRVYTHSAVSIGQYVLDQQFDSVVSQHSLALWEPPVEVPWQGAGASFYPANRVDSGSPRTMISSVHSSTFHSNHSGFLSSTLKLQRTEILRQSTLMLVLRYKPLQPTQALARFSHSTNKSTLQPPNTSVITWQMHHLLGVTLLTHRVATTRNMTACFFLDPNFRNILGTRLSSRCL